MKISKYLHVSISNITITAGIPLPTYTTSCPPTRTCGCNNNYNIAKRGDVILPPHITSCLPTLTCGHKNNCNIVKRTDVLLLLQTTLRHHLQLLATYHSRIKITTTRQDVHKKMANTTSTRKSLRRLFYRHFVTKRPRHLSTSGPRHILQQRRHSGTSWYLRRQITSTKRCKWILKRIIWPRQHLYWEHLGA